MLVLLWPNPLQLNNSLIALYNNKLNLKVVRTPPVHQLRITVLVTNLFKVSTAMRTPQLTH